MLISDIARKVPSDTSAIIAHQDSSEQAADEQGKLNPRTVQRFVKQHADDHANVNRQNGVEHIHVMNIDATVLLLHTNVERFLHFRC
jgi:hypothetical protein